MKTIWKCTVPIEDDFTVTLPNGGQIIHLAQQHPTDEALTMWALVETEAPMVQRTFTVVGTGQKIGHFDQPDLIITYVGTALMFDGRLVYHLFEWRPA